MPTIQQLDITFVLVLRMMQSNISRTLTVVVLLSILSEAACFATPSSTDSSEPSTTASDNNLGSNFYTYKSMKRMEIPALLYSTCARATCKLLRRRPQIVPPSRSISSKPSSPKASTKTHQPRIAIVTGSNTGVGYETAKSLVLNHGYHVIIASRSLEKGTSACESINALVSSSTIDSGADTTTSGSEGKALWEGPLDLSDLDSVRSFATKIQENPKYKTIDVLINNAGVNSAGAITGSATTATTEEESKARPMDVVFSTNFLGHFLLTNILLDQCERVVNLSSVMHHFPVYSNHDKYGDIDSTAYWKDKALAPPSVEENSDATTTSKKKKTKRKTYGPSKLAALLFTSELQRRYGDKMLSIAVNPGAVYSDIWRNYSKVQQKLFRQLYLTPEQGCQTSVAAAVLEWNNNEVAPSGQTIYLQPYRLPPQRAGKTTAPFPMLEMLGPYMGFRLTTPRLPKDCGVRASQSLFEVCEELTQCQFSR